MVQTSKQSRNVSRLAVARLDPHEPDAVTGHPDVHEGEGMGEDEGEGEAECVGEDEEGEGEEESVARGSR